MILLKATREASSMQTWRNSHPTPRPLLLALAVAGDAMAYLIESGELFDVVVDHLAGPFAFIATGRLGRLQGAQLAQSQTLEHAAHSGRRDADVAAISLPGLRWRRKLSIRSITGCGVG
jgi:hypothetical protein